MVRVNCAAIPATLIESELFGREKGAYTGALTRQIGRFELADGSTIFLDEIGDLPPDVQVKLLRVLEDKQIERLGSSKATKIDTRIIAATHRDLEKRIEADTFREDLYYRLNVFPIRVPPLRERTEDIPMLVWRFVEDFSAAFGKRVESITKDNMEMLQRYAWPGNVRELRNLVERAVIGANGPRLTIALPQTSSAADATQRQARRRGEGAHQGRARQHQVADSRRRRRRRSARAQSHDPRDAHGETGAPAPASLTPTFRAPSAIRGIRAARRGGRSLVDRRQLEAAQEHSGCRSCQPSAWYVCCSWPARGAPSCCAGGAGARHKSARSRLAVAGLAHPHRAGLPRVSSVDRGQRGVHRAVRGGVGHRGRDAPAGPFASGLRGCWRCWNPHRRRPGSSSISSRKRAAWITSRRCATLTGCSRPPDHAEQSGSSYGSLRHSDESPLVIER